MRLSQRNRGKGGSVIVDEADTGVRAGSDAFNGPVVKERVD